MFFLWVINGNLDFNSRYFHASRASLLNELKTIHNMKGVKSKLASVRMQNGSSAGVVLFDFVGVINHMFQDSRIFCKENIAARYCIWSGKADDCGGMYGEIHRGTKWKEAVLGPMVGRCVTDPLLDPCAIVSRRTESMLHW